ncbi:Uma2 family endonuclease [Methylobacterium sp. NEAU 140]|uniref:Uma2 family endonuclease n=1 Tax=Methylobacterium sp. NEAU 140 TaxID=3064945 RepID=UPI0027341FBB|nr:Uma2 family endonuclease [Methylobacterium sp. NEAU 140]MDP4022149.1 Uma2 family endonuclease [Methylobacterium sp. NEAU 140]
MLDRKPEPMSVAAFFAWAETQAERYELVGGVPVRMMAGARNVHDDIVVNLLALLRGALRGSGCRPFTGDGSVETLPGQIRRPDVGVDCGARDPAAMQAAEPRLVVEVLSPTTRDFDAFAKLAEYKTVASLTHILLVEPNAAEIRLWSRGADGAWAEARVAGLDAAVALPGLGLSLPLAEIYDGVSFPARPRLVAHDPADDPAANG